MLVFAIFKLKDSIISFLTRNHGLMKQSASLWRSAPLRATEGSFLTCHRTKQELWRITHKRMKTHLSWCELFTCGRLHPSVRGCTRLWDSTLQQIRNHLYTTVHHHFYIYAFYIWSLIKLRANGWMECHAGHSKKKLAVKQIKLSEYLRRICHIYCLPIFVQSCYCIVNIASAACAVVQET